jgi:hypothetical protein
MSNISTWGSPNRSGPFYERQYYSRDGNPTTSKTIYPFQEASIDTTLAAEQSAYNLANLQKIQKCSDFASLGAALSAMGVPGHRNFLGVSRNAGTSIV